MNDNNYITILGWMVNKLKLKGHPLLVFAIIHGFSQDGKSKFTGSLSYLQKATNSSRGTVIKSLKELTDKNLVIKETESLNNITFNKYLTNESVVQKMNHPHTIIEPGGGIETERGGGAEIVPNITNLDNTNINIIEEKGMSLFPDDYLTSKKTKINFEEIKDTFNLLVNNCNIPKVKKITSSRENALKKILKEYSLEQIGDVFKLAIASKFLCGQNQRGFTASFDWLINFNNFTKTIEGNYNNKTQNQPQQGDSNSASQMFLNHTS